MHRKAKLILGLGGIFTITRILLDQKHIVDRAREVLSADTRTLPSCPELFMQSHFMTIRASRGRTGNNLFQLLSLIGTAMKYCYTPLLDKKDFKRLNETFDLSFLADLPKRDFHWNVMNTDPCYLYPTKLDSLSTTLNWTLDGYMQSWRYMHGHESYIRSLIKFRPDIMRDASHYIQGLRKRHEIKKNDIIVCIHIRRGDFVKITTLGYIISDVTYINRSMAYYRNNFGRNKIIYVVVSDDMAWVKANIKGSDVNYSERRSAAVDMAIMSLCNHSIITAGSFGYLGAWLNGGSVVYDSRFPTPGSTLAKTFNKTDYYPKSWIAM